MKTYYEPKTMEFTLHVLNILKNSGRHKGLGVVITYDGEPMGLAIHDDAEGEICVVFEYPDE